MEPLRFDSIQILLLIVNFNFVVMGISLIFTRKGNRKANRYLALFLLLVAWVNTHYVFHYQKSMFLHFPNLIGTHMPFLFAIPPMLYFYFKKVFRPNLRIWGRQLVHFIPALAVFGYYIPLYFSSNGYKINFIRTGECYINSNMFSAFFFLYFLSYLLWVVGFIWKQRSANDNRNTAGLLQYTKGILIVGFITLSLLIAMVPLKLPFLYSALFSSLLYSYLIYQVFFKPELFFSLQLSASGTDQKYTLNSLSEEELSSISRVVMSYLKTEQVYLNDQLSLPEVARDLNLSSHHISQAVNRKNKLNFNELINRYRVEHARRLMLNPHFKQYTMEAVGNMSGFKTRQTFINAFKKVYNCPPAYYLKHYWTRQVKDKVIL